MMKANVTVRSRTRKPRNRIIGGFVPLPYEMIDSRAYKETMGSALKVLILCMRKVKTHHPIDRFSYQFELTYPEAKKQGICHSSFCRGMKQLQRVGFVDCVFRGGMRFQGQSSSRYRLSQRWKLYGTPEFRETWDGFSEDVHGA